MLKIYHNNRCGKSRAALATLQSCGQDFETVLYLDNPPEAKELRHLLNLLHKKPLDIIRTKEKVFLEQFKGKTLSDEQWIQAIVAHPILLERPIVVHDEKAWIVRSAEAIEDLNKDLTSLD